MKRTVFLSIAVLPVLLMANHYEKNLQVFTVNTAEQRCTTPLKLIYKGDKAGYAKEIAKNKDDVISSVFDGAQTMLDGGGLAGGLIVGLGVLGVNSLVDAAVGDYEYLYVTECNSGENKTRLMTLVVSNDKMSELQWVSAAKRDQIRGGR